MCETSVLQDQINRMRYMEDDIEAFKGFIAERLDYFGEIFHNTLIDMQVQMNEEAWTYQQIKDKGRNQNGESNF